MNNGPNDFSIFQLTVLVLRATILPFGSVSPLSLTNVPATSGSEKVQTNPK